MNKMKRYKTLFLITELVLFVPLIIFFLGWLKLPIAVIACVVTAAGGICAYQSVEYKEIQYDAKYILITAGVLTVWLIFSGIGRFSYQNSDWMVRNAILRDLVDYDWPVIYDFTKGNNLYSQYLPDQRAGLIYYFTFWLPAALAGKLGGWNAANLLLFVWAFVFLLLTIFWLNVFIGRKSFCTLFVLIFFSGLDIIGAVLMNGVYTLQPAIHIEWWAGLIQYSSNTTQLYWVFNQCLPCWLITAVMLNVKKPWVTAFIACTLFPYAPFCMFGMVPAALYFIFMLMKKENKKIFVQEILNVIKSPAVPFAAVLLITFGSFFLSANSSISIRGFIWKYWENIPAGAATYISFLVLEFGIYALLLYKTEKKNSLYWFAVLELTLIPLYKMTPANDFCMRASIVPLFILMALVIKNACDRLNKKDVCSVLLVAALCIGAVTPMHEMVRSVENTVTMSPEQYLNEDIYSIGEPRTELGAEICGNQFYAENFNNFFYKHLSRKS